MAGKLLAGALIGWLIAFFSICAIAGEMPGDSAGMRITLFLSLAPGVIIGIIVTYIINRFSQHSVSEEEDHLLENRLEKLKSLFDQGIITQEEFNEQKQKILERM